MSNRKQRAAWRAAKQRYRDSHEQRCRACSRLRDLRGARCSVCRALDRERRLPGLEHDTEAHAAMLRLAQEPTAVCDVSGLTAAQLATVGVPLHVDRRFPYAGYVPLNMQLLAAPLNLIKGRSLDVPAWAVDELRQAFDPRPEVDPFGATEELWDATSDRIRS